MGCFSNYSNLVAFQCSKFSRSTSSFVVAFHRLSCSHQKPSIGIQSAESLILLIWIGFTLRWNNPITSIHPKGIMRHFSFEGRKGRGLQSHNTKMTIESPIQINMVMQRVNNYFTLSFQSSYQSCQPSYESIIDWGHRSVEDFKASINQQTCQASCAALGINRTKA